MGSKFEGHEHQELAGLLKQARERAGLSQNQLAKLLEKKHSYVWRIEKGVQRLDLGELMAFTDAIGTDLVAIIQEMLELRKARRDAPNREAENGA